MFFSMQSPTLFASILSRQLLLVHRTSDKRIIFKKGKRFITNPSSWCIVHAVKQEDSKQYEIDTEKAKEALKELDQKIQSVPNNITNNSNNNNAEVYSPKITAVFDEELTKGPVSESGKLEISESFLANLAGGLVLFTIFYNVLFYSVIKPSIDGVP